MLGMTAASAVWMFVPPFQIPKLQSRLNLSLKYHFCDEPPPPPSSPGLWLIVLLGLMKLSTFVEAHKLHHKPKKEMLGCTGQFLSPDVCATK
jgi:hypothetical protein